MEAGKDKPVFVSEELYFGSDLTFTEVHIKCRELGLKKMINISDETIQAWYIEFLREKWDSRRFNERVSEMRNIKTYGERIDIADWFEKEAVYTPRQVATLIQMRINEMILKADRVLAGKEIEVELPGIEINLDEIKYRISKTVTDYYHNQCTDSFDQVYNILLQQVLDSLHIKRKQNNPRIGIGSRMKAKLGF